MFLVVDVKGVLGCVSRGFLGAFGPLRTRVDRGVKAPETLALKTPGAYSFWSLSTSKGVVIKMQKLSKRHGVGAVFSGFLGFFTFFIFS